MVFKYYLALVPEKAFSKLPSKIPMMMIQKEGKRKMKTNNYSEKQYY